MLTVDLVQARRRGDRLFLRKMNQDVQDRALIIAKAYIDIAQSNIDQSKSNFTKKCATVETDARDMKLAGGLLKLVSDRCTFEMSSNLDPSELRERVFQEASRQRKAAESSSDFRRDDILEAAGLDSQLSKEEVEHLLFADLKSAHLLTSFEPVSAPDLVEHYQKAQGQAVLLKATRVTVEIHPKPASAARKLFHKLKFLGLVHSIESLRDGSYKIEIDGPFSLFRSVTKYGLKLAMLVPALDEFGAWKLHADILWGKDKMPLSFELEGAGQTPSRRTRKKPRLSDEVALLVKRFEALKSAWSVTSSNEILELRGVGLCIPDLEFVHQETGEVVYLEVMGFWSRTAVWKRVELVEAGLPQRIIFAVSQRLRVSAEVLDDESPGSLYIYKGVMSAARIAELLG
ncbi:DUF790 family protein [Myxococcota bacterium]|nr:DUF790 family protein [Myxococcota bacterium]